MALYAKGLAINFKLFYIMERELHFCEIYPNPILNNQDNVMNLFLGDGKLVFFVNTTKDSDQSIYMELQAR